MKEYAKKLKTQTVLFAIASVVLTVIQVLAHRGIIPASYTNEHFFDFWRGFIGGVSAGVTMLLIVGIIINIRALTNEARLKKLYVKENDERMAEVALRGKSAGTTAGICFLLIGGIISGYFNITVFATAIVCAISLSLFIAGGKIYYSKKL